MRNAHKSLQKDGKGPNTMLVICTAFMKNKARYILHQEKSKDFIRRYSLDKSNCQHGNGLGDGYERQSETYRLPTRHVLIAFSDCIDLVGSSSVNKRDS